MSGVWQRVPPRDTGLGAKPFDPGGRGSTPVDARRDAFPLTGWVAWGCRFDLGRRKRTVVPIARGVHTEFSDAFRVYA